MEESFSTTPEVSAGASPASDASPASTAVDLGGAQGATTGAETTAPAEQTATQSESVAAGDAAGEEAPEWLLSDEEVNQAPDQWREKLTSLLSGYKSLESDHRTIKQDHEALTARAAVLDGLGAYATDQNGQVMRDPNGFPIMTTSPFLQGLAKQENGDVLTDRLATDLWYMERPGMNGQTYGDALLQMIGLDPKMVEQYKAGAQSQVTGEAATAEEIKAVEDVFQNRAYSEAFKNLTRSEQDGIINLLNDYKDADAEAILKREAGRLDQERKLQEVESYQKQQAEQEVKTFWSGVHDTYNQHLIQVNRDSIAALTKQIGSQVTFSSDPTTNTIQTNAIGGMIAALCNQQTRFAMEPVLQALGVQYDQQIDGMLGQYETAMQDYFTLKAASENPRFAQYRNDQKMNEAKSLADGLQQRVMAKLAPIGAKLAKVLAGQNQELRDQKNVNLTAAQQGRPTLGSNGSVATNGKQIPQGIDPFSVEFLQAIS